MVRGPYPGCCLHDNQSIVTKILTNRALQTAGGPPCLIVSVADHSIGAASVAIRVSVASVRPQPPPDDEAEQQK